MIRLFISTTRAAILIRRRRTVSNCATRQAKRFGIRARRNRRNWFAVALPHEVRSAARCVFQAFRWFSACPRRQYRSAYSDRPVPWRRLVTMNRVSALCGLASTRATMRRTQLQVLAPS